MHDAKAGKFLSPRVYTAGQGFNLTGPYPGAPTLKPTTPEEARKGVQAHKALKVDFIKLWMGDKGFTPDVVEAIVDEAKKQNIPIVAHIGNAAQVKQLADLGVTDFMHEARDGMNPEFIAYAKVEGVVVCADARPGAVALVLLRTSRNPDDGSEIRRVLRARAARC